MLGFILGTLCLIGLVKTVRRARYGYGCCGGGYGHGPHALGGCGDVCSPRAPFPPRGPFGHHGPWDAPRHGDPARHMLRGLFERLGTTPGQERVILEAVNALRAQGQEFRGAAEATGTAASRAFRADSFDVAVLGDAFAKQSLAMESAQKAVVEALHKVHEALDEDQRRILADLLDRGLDLFGRFTHSHHHPYRV